MGRNLPRFLRGEAAVGSWGLLCLLAGKTALGGSSSTKLPIRRSAGRKRGGQKDSLCEQTHQQGLKEVLEATTRGKTALKAAKIFLVQGDSNTCVLCELRER